MKKSSTIALALGACALVSSGCYTIVNSPYASAREREPEYTSSRLDERPDSDLYSPRLGRFDRGNNPYGGYPGNGYGGPGGSPIFGYDSNNGLYGFGSGYGNPYSSAYGPNGYGFDPYYQGDTGLYIPPGYELVTTQELEQLRLDNSGVLSNTEPVVAPPTAAEVKALQDKQVKQDRYIWGQRGTRSRTVPTGISRSSTGSSSGSVKSASSSKTAAKSSSKSSSSETRAPKKRRR